MSTLQVSGEPFLVAQNMRRPTVSTDGTLVLLPPRRQRPLNLAVVGRDGTVLSRIDEPRLRAVGGALSPDGNRFAVAELMDDKTDIWVYDLVRHTRDGVAGSPAWSPDGRSVFYDVRPGGTKRAAADGSERSEDIADGRAPVAAYDGSTLFYVTQDKDGLRLWYRPLATRDARPAPFIDQTFYSISAAPSPDGRFVAYAAGTVPGQTDVYLRRFPPTDGVWQVSSNGGTSPRWTTDGRLLFARGPDIFEVTVSTTPDVTISAPQRLFTRTSPAGTTAPAAFDVTPDGTRFVVFEPVADAGEEHLAAALNWFADAPR
jgi:hypothetical protein